jgi:two-component system LytT family response regulator
MMSYKTIIADDEQVARSRLRRLLQLDFPEIELIAEASNGIEARQLIDTHKPDLVFLDIEMPGATGLDVVETATHKPFVVFVTAYDHYAIQAFKALTIDYILKPITQDQLAIAIEKFKRLSAPPDFNRLIATLNNEMKGHHKSRLPVIIGDSIKYVPYDSIFCFEADQKYTSVFSKDATYITEKSLVQLEEILPKDTFIRIHRKHIVNVNYIDKIKHWFDRKFKVVLTVPFDRELIVSRSYFDNIKNL